MLHPVIHVQPFSTYFIQLELAVYLAVCAFFFRAYVVLDKVTYELYAYVGKYEKIRTYYFDHRYFCYFRENKILRDGFLFLDETAL